MIIIKIRGDIAADIYWAYLDQGRGVVALIMLDTLPDFLKDQVPKTGDGREFPPKIYFLRQAQ